MSSFSWHSHIRGIENREKLGLNEINTGLIGNFNCRKSAKFISELLKKKKKSQIIIFTGNSGSGKTALAFAVAKEIGKDIPFQMVNGAEIQSSKKKKTLILSENCRKAVGINFFENSEIFEGEIRDIFIDNQFKKFNELTNPIVHLILKTLEGSLRLKLHNSLGKSFIEENPKIGNIIRISPNLEKVKIIGVSRNSESTTIHSEKIYTSVPAGKVCKKKNIIQKITLFDLDYANVDFFQKNKKYQINPPENIEEEVNLLVSKYIEEERAEFVPGIFFIDEAHLLDDENLFFLTKLADLKFSPLIIFATNRETNFNFEKFAGSSFSGSFFKKCLNVHINPLEMKNCSKILAVRAKNLKIILTGSCLVRCGLLSEKKSLRMGIILVNFSKFLMNLYKKDFINHQILSATSLFFFNYHESLKLIKTGESMLSIMRIF